jgi:hypothetical protein
MGRIRQVYLTAHETVTITRVDKTEEMNTEHGHIESNRDDDQTEHASDEVFDPHFLPLEGTCKREVQA